MGHKANSEANAEELKISRRSLVILLVFVCGNCILSWLMFFVIYAQVNLNTQSITEIKAQGFVPLNEGVTRQDLDELRESIRSMEKLQDGFEDHLEFDDKKIQQQTQHK